MKIFKISKNPVSTIESSLRQVEVPKPIVREIKRVKMNSHASVPITERSNGSNYFVKMRNGIGRLMKHFSHPRPASK